MFNNVHSDAESKKMPQDVPDTFPPAARENGFNLKHHLLRRVTLFALAIGIFTSGLVLYQAREGIHLHIAHTGSTVERLISSEAAQPRGSFQHGLTGLALASLDDIGQLLGICVAVEDIYKQPIVQRCFDEEAAPPRLVRLAI